MRNSKLTEILREIGLSDNESKVYLAALSLGPTTIKKIANSAEINRTTAYPVISALQTKGLMKIDVEGFKKRYVAESPERLESIIDQSRERFKKRLPDFLSLYNLEGGEGFIKYYEGQEAVKSVYEKNIKDIKPGEEYMVISDAEKVFDMYGQWFDKFIERRGKLNINIRMILQNNPWAQDYKKYERNYNQSIRFLPKEIDLVTNLVVTPQRVLIHQLNPPIIGIVIENKSAIKMHQQLFEVLWNTCKDTQ